MRREILTSTALDPLGLSVGRQLHRGPAGRYVDRLVAIIQVAANQIVLTYADPPYVSWATPIDVATDCADRPFDTCISDDGTVHLIYTEDSTNYLVTRPLAFANGQWTPGMKTVIYDGAISQYASVAIDDSGTVWVAWTRSSGAVKYIHVKSSSDGGATWGTGLSDAGAQVSVGASSACAKLVTAPDALHVVYTEADWNILIRTRPNATGIWESATLIAGSDVSSTDFDAAISASGLLGVVFSRDGLQYREYDGNIWSALQTLDSHASSMPHLKFQGNVPVVTYFVDEGSGRNSMKFVTHTAGSFSAPAPLDSRAGAFNKVLLYSLESGIYHDVTASAANDTVGDVYHPSHGALLNQAGDCIYFGMSDRFRLLHVTLATAGIGGAVSFGYWDGAGWRSFDPTGGTFEFDSTDRTLVLWTDYHSIPGDWQQSVVDGSRLFWIKAEVTTDCSTAPVGTRLDTIGPVTTWALRR